LKRISKYDGLKSFVGDDNIHNEAHYVASNILIILKRLNLFAAAIISAPLVVQKRFLDRERIKNIK